MKTLSELKEQLTTLQQEARSLALKAHASDAEKARLVAIMGDDGTGTHQASAYGQLRARIKALEAFDGNDETMRSIGHRERDETAVDAITRQVTAGVLSELEPQVRGLVLNQAPAVLRHGRGEPIIGAETPFQDAINALRRGQFKSVQFPLYDSARLKSLAESVDSAGGYLVPTEQSTQIVEMLRAKAAVRAAGATVIAMSSDLLEIPRQEDGATAYWVAENAQITASEQEWGQVELRPHKLAALTRLSSELFTDSNPAIEGLIMDDLARVLALEEDIKYLRGDGTGNAPTGLENITGVNATTLGSGDGDTPGFDDLADMAYRLDADDVPTQGRAWIAHPRVQNTLRKITDATSGQYIWADPAAPGDPPTVWGYPVYFTTAIPITLTVGGSDDCTNLYFGAWPEFIIGQRKTLELRASDVAGDAFEYDQVFIRAIMRVDGNVRHPASFEVLKGVRP